MELSKKQRELLRWYAAGHSIQMVAQYIDVDTREASKMLFELGVEGKYEAERLLAGASEVDELVPSNDNLPNAGEEVPEFIPELDPNINKLSHYDKREIAARGGNDIDLIPMALHQAFRLDIRWRPLAEVKAKWMLHAGNENNLKAAVKEFSPSAFKRFYGEHDVEFTSEGEEDAT